MADTLFDALRAGQKTEDVLEWTTHEARGHFNTVMIRETATFARLNPEDWVQAIIQWLTQANIIASTLKQLCGGRVHQRTSLNHQAIWLKAFQGWATPTTDETSRTHSGV
jgi:hypothetical protein